LTRSCSQALPSPRPRASPRSRSPGRNWPTRRCGCL
jgi:hypothetical protein